MPWIRLVAITIAVLLAAASPASAATFTVTTTGDDLGYCERPDGGDCPSIRAALAATLETQGPDQDVVNVPEGRYELTQPLEIRASVALVGAGARKTTIVAAPDSRAIEITSTAAALSHLTLSDGQAPDDYSLQGGNLLAQNSDAELDHVRVTGGFAISGGGIANRNGHMTITNSLIDDNRASDGGGIFNYGGDGEAATLVLRDSTVAFNHAGHAGAISSRENELNSVALESATIARNAADEEYATGVGGIFFDSGTVSSHGSLIAHNLLADGSTQNCDQALSPSEGNNLESGTDCGFSAASDRAGATPDLATGLANLGGETDVLSFGAASHALDIGGTCSVTDQTGALRPQGLGCDAGAYEYRTVATPPPPPNPTPTPTPTPVPTPVATPVAGKSVEAEPVSGKVLVKLPGSKKFAELDPSVIPNGSEVDTRHGVVEITRSDGGTAKFYDGVFKLSQAGGVTTATLSEKLDCRPAGRKARAAAKKTKTRRLWGEGKGKFRTRGQYSAATIRGTKWYVQDTCTSTVTKVKEGVVEVRDEVKKTKKILRRGKSYTARPKR